MEKRRGNIGQAAQGSFSKVLIRYLRYRTTYRMVETR